jgi:pyruvate dehydrogenase E2 component (dihydrolipoamide acetyltransferase)
MKTFNLPDLGEGLPEAEIVKWQVAEGDTVEADQPLASVETAKAVVDVPSPYSGTIARMHAKEGDIVETHKPLVDFDLGDGGGAADQARPANEAPAEEPPEDAAREDSGTVVGQMQSSDEVLEENAIVRKKQRKKAAGRPKAAPAVRALAKREGVDLGAIEATGSKGQITTDDVQRYIESAGTKPEAAPAARASAPKPHKLPSGGIKEELRGPRRAMAQSMSRSRDEVTPCTLFDDADIQHWSPGQDITARVLRGIVAGCHAEPGLNGFFDGASLTRQVMNNIDVAMAVDTPDGLLVPVVRDVAGKDGNALRADLNRIKDATRNRTVAPEEMRDYTIMLSNFGMMAGRYATPVIVPPAIAIIGTGGIRHDVVGVMGGIEVHKRIPLSLTFDHRCVTGGEACRFLGAMIQDLRKTQ